MKARGIVPEDTELTGRPEGVEAWDELDDTRRAVYARLMETDAAFAEHTDARVGRLIEALDEMGVYNDTLFIYVAGDNGASAEGGLDGTSPSTSRCSATVASTTTGLTRANDQRVTTPNPERGCGKLEFRRSANVVGRNRSGAAGLVSRRGA